MPQISSIMRDMLQDMNRGYNERLPAGFRLEYDAVMGYAGVVVDYMLFGPGEYVEGVFHYSAETAIREACDYVGKGGWERWQQSAKGREPATDKQIAFLGKLLLSSTFEADEVDRMQQEFANTQTKAVAGRLIDTCLKRIKARDKQARAQAERERKKKVEKRKAAEEAGKAIFG